MTAPERAPRQAGLGDLFARLLGEGRQLVADYTLLAVLDARRAAIQLTWILSSGLVVSVLLVTAWLALVTALMVWLFETRLSWPAALAIGALINIAGAGALLWWMRSLVIEKPFTALLRRQLKGENHDGPGSCNPEGRAAHHAPPPRAGEHRAGDRAARHAHAVLAQRADRRGGARLSGGRRRRAATSRERSAFRPTPQR